MAEFGVLPQSPALREAQVDALGELLSRDPMGFTKQDRAAVVAALRGQRQRWELSEAAGVKVKTPRSKAPLSTATPRSAEELDL
jgi:hypothetical protein